MITVPSFPQAICVLMGKELHVVKIKISLCALNFKRTVLAYKSNTNMLLKAFKKNMTEEK